MISSTSPAPSVFDNALALKFTIRARAGGAIKFSIKYNAARDQERIENLIANGRTPPPVDTTGSPDQFAT